VQRALYNGSSEGCHIFLDGVRYTKELISPIAQVDLTIGTISGPSSRNLIFDICTFQFIIAGQHHHYATVTYLFDTILSIRVHILYSDWVFDYFFLPTPIYSKPFNGLKFFLTSNFLLSTTNLVSSQHFKVCLTSLFSKDPGVCLQNVIGRQGKRLDLLEGRIAIRIVDLSVYKMR